MIRKIPGAAAVLSLAIFLSGCGHRQKECPAAAALSEASAMTVFPNGSSPDPAHALYSVRITNVTTDCEVDKPTHTVDASLEITFDVARAPNGAAFHGEVPYFVAVTGEGGRILARQIFHVDFDLEAGQASQTVTDNVSSTEIKLEREKHPYDYQILVGLQLTKAQLDYNRTVGPYTP